MALPSSELQLWPYFRDLRTVQVQVGTDTLRFLFDTGAGITALTPDAAARIGCAPRGRDVGHRMSGEPVTFQRCDTATLRWAGGESHLSPIGVFDLASVLPPELPRLDGALGLDAFRGRLVVLDWPANRIRVDGELPPGVPAPTLRPATGESGRSFSVFVRSTAARGEAWLLLDSGNLRGLLLAPHVLDDSLVDVASATEVWLGLDSLRSHRLPFTRAELILDGAIGTDFLQRGPLILDLRPWPAGPPSGRRPPPVAR